MKSYNLPYALITVLLVGLLSALALDRLDYFVRGLAIAFPGVVASILMLLIYKKNNINITQSIELSNFNTLNQHLIFICLITISILYLVSYQYRPWQFFLLMILAYLVILIEIFSSYHNINVIIFKTLLTSIVLIYSVTLKYPLYFGYTDLLGHIFLSTITYSSGNIIQEELSFFYSKSPIYHIFVAQCSHILGLDVKTALFLVTCIAFATIQLFVYLFSKIITRNTQLALLSSVLFSSSSVVIFYGTYMITRAFAFIGFVILLFLSFKISDVQNNRGLLKSIAIFISIFILSVHYISVMQFFLILVILYLCQFLCKSKVIITTNFLKLTITMLLGYSLYIAWVYTQVAIGSRLKIVYYLQPIIKETIKKGNEFTFLFNNVDTMIFLFFALIGIGYLLNRAKGKQGYFPVIGLLSLIFLIIYVPSPLNMLWQATKLFRADRLILFISPIMALVMSIGIYVFYIYSKSKMPKRAAGWLIVTFLCMFITMSIIATNASDCKDLWNKPRNYFNIAELVGFEFFNEVISQNSNIYSDYASYRYLTHEHNSFKIESIEAIYKYKGYIIFRKEEFLRNGLYFGSFGSNFLCTPSKENVPILFNNLDFNHKIFSNNATDLYLNRSYTITSDSRIRKKSEITEIVE